MNSFSSLGQPPSEHPPTFAHTASQLDFSGPNTHIPGVFREYNDFIVVCTATWIISVDVRIIVVNSRLLEARSCCFIVLVFCLCLYDFEELLLTQVVVILTLCWCLFVVVIVFQGCFRFS